MQKVSTLTGVLITAALLAAQSPAPADLNRVQSGAKAPDFKAVGVDGKSVSLSDFQGKNVVLVFYRGVW